MSIEWIYMNNEVWNWMNGNLVGIYVPAAQQSQNVNLYIQKHFVFNKKKSKNIWNFYPN